jgi:hypothetical protein
MNSRNLAGLFSDWRETTRAEAEAIVSGSWADLDRHQNRKRQLKQQIVDCTEAWQRRWPMTGETQADYEREFRPLVAELISLETRNGALLASQREAANGEIQCLDRTSQTLRGVQRAYGAAPEMQWTSYS